MKTYKDLEWEAHALSSLLGFDGAEQARLELDNGYEISVWKGVQLCDKKYSCSLLYYGDVELSKKFGHREFDTANQVSLYMEEIQKLPPKVVASGNH